MRSDRAAFFNPAGTRVPLEQYVNLTASSFPEGLRLVQRCPFRPVDIRRSITRQFQNVDRKSTVLSPHVVMMYLDNAIRKTSNVPYIQTHEWYLRYPFEQEANLDASAQAFLCGVTFSNRIRNHSRVIINALRLRRTETHGSTFLALHLRLEASDSMSMTKGRAKPSSQDLFDFLSRVEAFAVSRDVRKVYICSGRLAANYESVVTSFMHRTSVLWMNKSMLLGEDAAYRDSDIHWQKVDGTFVTPTPTEGAAVDLSILEEAELAVVTTYSSFSAAVYAKRCGGNGCRRVGEIYLYDMYLDGSFTNLLEYPCGYQFGVYLRFPPALVPPPPPSLRVLAYGYDKSSPIFTNRSKEI
jgi:hypothetical protein